MAAQRANSALRLIQALHPRDVQELARSLQTQASAADPIATPEETRAQLRRRTG